jgi:hypothetical protein
MCGIKSVELINKMKTFNETFADDIAERIIDICLVDSMPRRLEGDEYGKQQWLARQWDNVKCYNGGAAWDSAFRNMGASQQAEYLILLESDSGGLDEICALVHSNLERLFNEFGGIS